MCGVPTRAPSLKTSPPCLRRRPRGVSLGTSDCSAARSLPSPRLRHDGWRFHSGGGTATRRLRRCERLLERRLRFVLALNRARAIDAQRALIDYFAGLSAACSSFRRLSATGADLAALGWAVEYHARAAVRGRRRTPTPRGVADCEWPDVAVVSKAQWHLWVRRTTRARSRLAGHRNMEERPSDGRATQSGPTTPMAAPPHRPARACHAQPPHPPALYCGAWWAASDSRVPPTSAAVRATNSNHPRDATDDTAGTSTDPSATPPVHPAMPRSAMVARRR